MRLYLCARYGRKEELRAYAALATAAGCRVVSRWLYLDEPDGSTDPGERHRWATRDRDEILGCDALVFFAEPDPANTPGAGRGGRFCEWGMAAASRRMLILVGPVENCFHELAFRKFADWPAALEYLRPRKEEGVSLGAG